MQRDTADQLHVEVPHVEHASARFPHHGKRFRQQVVERFAALMARLELIGLGAQFRSLSFSICGSSALTARTVCRYFLISRSLRLPKIFLSSPVTMNLRP